MNVQLFYSYIFYQNGGLLRRYLTSDLLGLRKFRKNVHFTQQNSWPSYKISILAKILTKDNNADEVESVIIMMI